MVSGFKPVLDYVACFRPISAWQKDGGPVVFREVAGARSLTLPCGQCVGCRVQRARSWALRVQHEAQLHDASCFVTLTYAPEKLPPYGSLRYRDFQLFMKRLRRRLDKPVRFFVCGEYGENLSRPHYHACLFGVDFPDKRPLSLLGKSSGFRSALLETLWGLGHCHVGHLNAQSAGYAARYVLKKVTGDLAKTHYSVVDGDGVVHPLVPEFARMSLRPGVGGEWFARFRSDVFPGDCVVSNGARFGVPKYYDRLLERVDPAMREAVAEERELRGVALRSDGSPARLAVREEVERARLKTLRRSYECS